MDMEICYARIFSEILFSMQEVSEGQSDSNDLDGEEES